MFGNLIGAALGATVSMSELTEGMKEVSIKSLPKNVRGVKSNRYFRWRKRYAPERTPQTRASDRYLGKMHKMHFEEVKITPRQEGAFEGAIWVKGREHGKRARR